MKRNWTIEKLETLEDMNKVNPTKRYRSLIVEAREALGIEDTSSPNQDWTHGHVMAQGCIEAVVRNFNKRTFTPMKRRELESVIETMKEVLQQAPDNEVEERVKALGLHYWQIA